jgi:hypothetical protein
MNSEKNGFKVCFHIGFNVCRYTSAADTMHLRVEYETVRRLPGAAVQLELG